MLHSLSSAERRALGQSKRRQLSRQGNAEWRPDQVTRSALQIIAASMRGRVANLVPLKYEHMVASPFGFFRGAVPVMAADLAHMPNSGVVTQICGDAHVRNLGAYAAPDGRLVFDINDFDETIRGPFEWDLKRMATSLVLAGREVGARKPACEEAVLTLCSSYRKLMATFARLPVIEVARYLVHRLERITPVSQALHKAERATPESTLERLTHPLKGKPGAPGAAASLGRIFREEKPLLARLTASQAKGVLAAFDPYRESLLPERQHFLAQYRPIDFAFKVVGTGSIGLRDYLVYLEGNGPGDPLFLQFKEEPQSAYAPYHPDPAAAHHQGRRVAEGQRAMQLQTDPFLGWTSIAHRQYLVRQFCDHKASVDLTDLKGSGLTEYAEVCGELLARGHARSGDANILLGYLGNSDKFGYAIAAFASAYADQTEADWQLLVRARKPAHAASKSASSAAKTISAAPSGHLAGSSASGR
jgi:uncharacterized protein (DUF2252 family)